MAEQSRPCGFCRKPIPAGYLTCPHCGYSGGIGMGVGAGHVISPDARRAILDREVADEVRNGWRVASQTDTSAQLVKNRAPNGCLLILLFLLLIVPGILYLLLYKGEIGLFIQVDETGRVRKTSRS